MPEFDATLRLLSVQDFPAYCVGTDGSIWSKHSGGWRRLKPVRNTCGHLWVFLCPGKKFFFLHRLILQAFVGPCPEGMQCCHWDGDKSNCAVSNLRWDTPKANAADRVRHGTDFRGQRSPNAKLTNEQVQAIRQERGLSWKELASKYGISKSAIMMILTRRNWKHI
jgi:hypothetical protein